MTQRLHYQPTSHQPMPALPAEDPLPPYDTHARRARRARGEDVRLGEVTSAALSLLKDGVYAVLEPRLLRPIGIHFLYARCIPQTRMAPDKHLATQLDRLLCGCGAGPQHPTSAKPSYSEQPTA